MRNCPFCLKDVKEIDYKDVDLLKKYISSQVKIYPSRKTGVCKKHQRLLSVAIKRARIIGILPFVG